MRFGKLSLAIVSIAFLASCSSSQHVAEKGTMLNDANTVSASSNASNTPQQVSTTQAASQNGNKLKVSKYKTAAQ